MHPSSHAFENDFVFLGQGYVWEHIFDHHPKGARRVDESDLLVMSQFHTFKFGRPNNHTILAVRNNQQRVQRTKIENCESRECTFRSMTAWDSMFNAIK